MKVIYRELLYSYRRANEKAPGISNNHCRYWLDVVGLYYLYAGGHLKPEERILQALEAAEQFSAGVRRPFVIKQLGENNA